MPRNWKGKKNPKYKHGMKGTRFYNIWKFMNVRCNNKNRTQYKDYGGKGIKNEWVKFEDFRDDMLRSYNYHFKKFGKKNTTIDRKDNNKNYNKENCHWATIIEQERNKTSVLKFKIGNKLFSLPEIAEKFNLNYRMLYSRIHTRKMTIKEAIFTPNRYKNKTICNTRKNIKNLSNPPIKVK